MGLIAQGSESTPLAGYDFDGSSTHASEIKVVDLSRVGASDLDWVLGSGSGWFTQNASLASTRMKSSFVDSAVEDHTSIVNNISTGRGGASEVVVLDSRADGIEQISTFLASRTNLSAIHVVSHGSVGEVQSGSTQLSGQKLTQYASQAHLWGGALARKATFCSMVAIFLREIWENASSMKWPG